MRDLQLFILGSMKMLMSMDFITDIKMGERLMGMRLSHGIGDIFE
jgi:hypothetical protein